MAWVYRTGTQAPDLLISNAYDDVLQGSWGDDLLLDGGRYKHPNLDILNGGSGDDRMRARWGRDTLQGSVGDDILISRSDAGEPEIAQDPLLTKFNLGEPIADSNDTMTGGVGADEFLFRLDLNARPEIIAAHTDMAGNIDWEGVAGENGAAHLHWVEGIGKDTIRDFYKDEGDKIIIEGHTVAIESIVYSDSNGDGRKDTSTITLKSDQGGAGSHDGDILGVIRVTGDLVLDTDIMINAGVHHGYTDSIDEELNWSNVTPTAGNDVLRTVAANATLRGLDGDDMLLDGSRKGDKDRDTFDGGTGNDVIRSRWGIDTLRGGAGDDILVSRSDAGEPEIAQDTKETKVYKYEPFLEANDTLTGGLGADTFFFRFDLNARKNIIDKHSENDGHIHWHDVAGENRSPHLHWVDGIGTDTITDFYRAEGDKIVLEGHTVNVEAIRYVDTNGDRRIDMSVIYVESEQGRSGSHDEDSLGKIRVFGDKVEWWDIMVNSGPTHGVAGTLDDYAVL